MHKLHVVYGGRTYISNQGDSHLAVYIFIFLQSLRVHCQGWRTRQAAELQN